MSDPTIKAWAREDVYMKRISELEAQNAQMLELYSLLASAWFYGNWKAETKNERDMQAVMEREGYWPTTEEEILARAAIAAVQSNASTNSLNSANSLE